MPASPTRAQMAELVDALASGASVRMDVEVRVLFWAPFFPQDHWLQADPPDSFAQSLHSEGRVVRIALELQYLTQARKSGRHKFQRRAPKRPETHHKIAADLKYVNQTDVSEVGRMAAMPILKRRNLLNQPRATNRNTAKQSISPKGRLPQPFGDQAFSML